MLKIKKTLMFFLLCGLTVGAFSQTNERTLSLDECIKTALQNNLGVAVEILNPEIADASIALARERFLPQLSLRYFTQNTNTPSFSWIDSSDQLTTDYNNYVAYFEQNLPFGTNITATLFSYQNETNQRFQTINPRFGSTLQFDVTQPLLKNFGYRVNRREIIIAKNSREMSDSQLKQVLLETVYNVEEAYWNLVFSIEDLRVRHQSLSLARDLLKKNRREVEVGTLAPIEILSAEAEVATREAEILQAEGMVKNNENILKTIINLDLEGARGVYSVVPADSPSYTKMEISVEEALQTAMNKRPDLESYRWDIKSKDIDFVYAKNQLLPELSLEASYWSPGVSGTQILYQDNNPLTNIVIGTIPGEVSDALRDALKFQYHYRPTLSFHAASMPKPRQAWIRPNSGSKTRNSRFSWRSVMPSRPSRPISNVSRHTQWPESWRRKNWRPKRKSKWWDSPPTISSSSTSGIWPTPAARN